MENTCTFLLAKEKTWKRIFYTNSELSQNRTGKQMPPKTTVYWLFNMLFSLSLFWLKNWRFSVNSCKAFFNELLFPYANLSELNNFPWLRGKEVNYFAQICIIWGNH